MNVGPEMRNCYWLAGVLQGGLIGLAAATVGLAGEAAQHLHVRTLFPLPLCVCTLTSGSAVLQSIVPPVLRSFTDQDSRVRYYACEALYNIAKVTRGDFIVFFNDVFDALCKLSADSDLHVQQAAHLLDRLVKVSREAAGGQRESERGRCLAVRTS